MIKLTVSRNDNIYECFPDIAKAPDGTLVCCYRECMGHGPYPFSRLVSRRSFDNGKNWTERKILLEGIPKTEDVDKNRAWLEKDAIAGYEESLSRINEDWQIGMSINCSRLICLADGSLLLIADLNCNEGWINCIWRSNNNGETWDGPKKLDIPQGIVPSLTQLKNGKIIIGLVTVTEIVPFICMSEDNGCTWSKPVYLPHDDKYLPAEVSYIELDDGTIVGFGRNCALEKKHLPSGGIKVISHDGGKSWVGPFDTWMLGMEGRPKAGILFSGEVCITYRCDMPNEMLAMHVMTQGAAKLEGTGDTIERMPVIEDIPSQLAKEKGKKRPWYMTDYYPGRTIILDVDRSVHRDSSYSGWVQLENGDIFVVDYINDDAPLAQIRAYIVNRSDIILFPEGDLPWLHPSGQPFRAITLAMARKQSKVVSKNQKEQMQTARA